MKTWGILAIAMTLAAAVFGFRHREWKSLQKRAQAVRQASPPPAAGPESAGRTLVKPDHAAFLRNLRDLMSTKHDPKARAAFTKQLESLSDDELRALCAAARAEVEPAPPGYYSTVALLAATALGGRNDRLAADLVAGMPQNDEHVAKCMERLLSEWVHRKNSRAAAEWLGPALAAGKFHGSPELKALTKLHEVAQTINAPIEALPRLRNRPEEEQAELMAAALIGVHSAEDARAFAAALLDWPAAETRRMALGAALKQLVTHDGFDAAAAWLDSAPDASAKQKDDARATLVMLAPSAEEMPQRVNWVVAQAAPDQQAPVAARLAHEWAWQDFNAAGAWLHENRGAPWRDAAVGAFAAIAGRIEPPTAFDWALTISDESLRRSSLHEIMRLWKNDNPEAAQAFLIASALPDSWKAELAKPPPANLPGSDR